MVVPTGLSADRNVWRGYKMMVREFSVIDLTPTCDIRAAEWYRYDLLERIPGAMDLIPALAASIWRDPGGFEMHLGQGRGLGLRWVPTADSSGVLTVNESAKCLSISVLCGGVDASADTETLHAFQGHILRQLHGTEFEGSCEVLQVKDRPLLATLALFVPEESANGPLFALADRCFGAAYFRQLGLV